jgi:hypothetical protein
LHLGLVDFGLGRGGNMNETDLFRNIHYPMYSYSVLRDQVP